MRKKHTNIFIVLLKATPFNLCVNYYSKFLKSGYEFAEAKAVDNMVAEYKFENDNIVQYLHDIIHIVPMDQVQFEESYTSKDLIYVSYNNFCRGNGQKPASSTIFFKRLKKELPFYEESRQLVLGTRKRCLKGVRFQ